ncbi:MAG: hypothetical protein A2275_11990 [Bacteroidetes bacterium RIFOXYA12_FULL_35_11]|nr:MAG: hypothetical protein A2X01_16960 [Bacteroidetes bacterium GWF2_35_48]OFY82509.1 MAG: hypothetical protein A2275_11990 [Bacteroidetes bacterium RIFOXYA12_FULL_35_11]OFZ01530.1 MAG: hypothetical protein A2491_01410 [Bacteroidetes bacterium RIFOXYC12_FULL_35_7]HBX53371.1 hypothetical protein [Bacteroidales bacterium]
MKGLAPNTGKIFEKITLLSCIKEYTLVGGTALSLQIGKRLSEDFDFCRWSSNLKSDKPIVDWPLIKAELETIGSVQNQNILGFDHVDFIVDGVKLSFFTKQQNLSPVENPVLFLNNIKLADIDAIGAMKIELILRRSAFRDYYDIYSILKEGRSLKSLLLKASKYSNYALKTKNALLFLLNGDNFKQEKNFSELAPEYKISNLEISQFIRETVEKDFPEITRNPDKKRD